MNSVKEFNYFIDTNLLIKAIDKNIKIFSAHFYFNPFAERYEVWSYPINIKIDNSWLILYDVDEETTNNIEYDCLCCEEYPLAFSAINEPCDISSLENFVNNVNQKVKSIDVYSIDERWEENSGVELIDADNCIVFNFSDCKLLIAATYNRTQQLCVLTDLNQISKYITDKKHRVHLVKPFSM